MPEAIPAAAAAFATWVVNATGATAGTLAFTAIYVTAYATAYIGLTAAVTMGISALAASQLPDPENLKVTRKQSRPLRYHLLGGASRFSGAYLHREAAGARLGVVLALAEGRLHDISRIYLNDDIATLGGSGATSRSGWVQEGENGRYGGGDLVRIETRLGEPTETHYGFLTADFGASWPTTARGDGIATLMMWCQHRSREAQTKLYPNGEPMPSVVGRAACYDWRQDSTVEGGSGSQRRDTPSTWGPSANPVVWTVFIEWHRLGRNWDRCIAPVLADLTVEADYCDELVDRVGGTEPRYACAGGYPSNTEPDVVRAALMATMDGWLSTDGKGRLVIKAGRYVEPSFTLPADHIEGYSWRAFQRDEESVNELLVSYVDPDQDYSLVEADAWRDEAAIEAMGQIRSESLQLNWVSSHSQARRLAKRKMTRLNPLRRGQVRAGIYGLNGLGHRYIRIRNPALPSMADAVVEVLNVEVDFAASQVVFDVILADEAIDDWTPAEEEGPAPGEIPLPDPGPVWVTRPEDFTATDADPDVSLTWTNPATIDHKYVGIYRATGSTDFGDAVLIAEDHGAPSGPGFYLDAAPGVGAHSYWLVPVDQALNEGDPVGPETVTLT